MSVHWRERLFGDHPGSDPDRMGVSNGKGSRSYFLCNRRHWPGRHAPKEAAMTEGKFLTPEEVSERYRGGISVGTLRNWRAMRIGPTFVKIGKAVLYPISELDTWDEQNTVTCRAPSRFTQQVGDGE